MTEQEWLKTRPPCIQALAAEFPLDYLVLLDGRVHYILGYTEGDMLMLSPVDPGVDYEAAMARMIYLCASHLRGLAN